MKIYIASPYTIGNKEENVLRQVKAAHEILDMGHTPFVPLLSHYLHKYRERPYNEWIKYDLQWLKECDALLRLSGESKGADIEVEFAEKNNILVFHSP